MLALAMELYTLKLVITVNQKNVWRLKRPHQTYSHDLHFEITELARRFFPETVLKQDTLLLYNLKECRGGKKVCSFFLLENSRPFSPWGPLDFLSTCLGKDSLNPGPTWTPPLGPDPSNSAWGSQIPVAAALWTLLA